EAIEAAAMALARRNPELLSIGVMGTDGQPLVATENHGSFWQTMEGEDSTATHMQLPIFRGDKQWGTVQTCFRGLSPGTWVSPSTGLAIFIALGGLIAYMFYLRKVLRHLDPSAVIPDRVKAVLDTMAEGVLVLDQKERIVLANQAFEAASGQSLQTLQGRKASQIPWKPGKDGSNETPMPWSQAAQDGEVHKSISMSLEAGAAKDRTFMVNSSPIFGTDGKQRGTMATFDDVTNLERKNVRLEKTLHRLEESRKKVKLQNEELTLLATRDALTHCLNRRAFFTEFDTHWNAADRYNHELSCIMVDVDHFKSINDNHGHQTGDEVLQKVAECLRQQARQCDIVCRYGGEEFCILLPHTGLDDAEKAAEKFRHALTEINVAGISVTASLGVSEISLKAETPQEMIDQADQCLYAAKRTGRNRVVRFDRMPEAPPEESAEPSTAEPAEHQDATAIPFHAVSALMSALSHRDPETAAHSRRVADLCIMSAEDLMSTSDCFVLEIAALLHDIGKIGVPDAILLKPGPLDEEEWKVMESHDLMGIEIINAAFNSIELTNIVRYHHAYFDGQAREESLPSGHDIPLRARILSIADAYDAITSDRVYRKGRTHEEAVVELRRCAGGQFDPELVERFIEAISARDQDRAARPLEARTETGLRIGLELERILSVIEAQDIAQLAAQAEHLSQIAGTLNLPQVAESAGQLSQAASTEGGLDQILETTNELVDLCKEVQSDCLGSSRQRLPEPPAQVEESINDVA
ncbi:MAG: diguanylate cyclase, partial [Phycisphaerae bacterium]|nr:diguanylate cyclase [Phycisphaerae bacterium]